MQLQQVQMGIREGEDWEVRSPDQQVLAKLPRHLTDGQVISIIEFAKRHEKAAFDEGREYGQAVLLAAQKQRFEALIDRIRSLEAHNTMLAEKIESLLDGE